VPGVAEDGAGSFAATLRGLRERAGLTQEELAERAGVTPHAISALERGTRTRPYPHTVRSIADALNVSDLERSGLIASVPRRNTAAAPGVQAGPPPARAADPARPRGGLVVPPTRLYGRDDDVAQIAHLARSADARLITLTGPGGVGKTRLAAAVAEDGLLRARGQGDAGECLERSYPSVPVAQRSRQPSGLTVSSGELALSPAEFTALTT